MNQCEATVFLAMQKEIDDSYRPPIRRKKTSNYKA